MEETINSIRNPHHVVSKRQDEKVLGGAKFGGAGARPATESARASLAGFDAKGVGVLQLL